MNKVVLYIEGTTSHDNGDLRKAFSKFLAKELNGRMPKIVMGDGKTQTIDKFYATPLKDGESRFLLVDSDKQLPAVDERTEYTSFNKKRSNRLVDCTTENTFFMVQEAEAWILS